MSLASALGSRLGHMKATSLPDLTEPQSDKQKLEALEIIHDEAVSLVEDLYRYIASSSVERYKPEPLRKINIYL